MRACIAVLASTTKLTFARSVDVCSYLSILPSCPVIVQNMTHTSYSLQKLVSLLLGEIASALRIALNTETSDLVFRTRVLGTYLHSQRNKSKVSPVAKLEFSVDIALRSWVKTDCYSLNFNLGLRLPEAVRRPRFTILKGFMYFIPQRGDGEVGVAMCLQEKYMERLKTDQPFVTFARHDG